MYEININQFNFKNVQINRVSGYNGYDIHFTVDDKLFNLMVANTQPKMVLNILHKFNEKDLCPVCNKTIYPHPIGNQPCLELKKLDKLLLKEFENVIKNLQ